MERKKLSIIMMLMVIEMIYASNKNKIDIDIGAILIRPLIITRSEDYFVKKFVKGEKGNFELGSQYISIEGPLDVPTVIKVEKKIKLLDENKNKVIVTTMIKGIENTTINKSGEILVLLSNSEVYNKVEFKSKLVLLNRLYLNGQEKTGDYKGIIPVYINYN